MYPDHIAAIEVKIFHHISAFITTHPISESSFIYIMYLSLCRGSCTMVIRASTRSLAIDACCQPFSLVTNTRRNLLRLSKMSLPRPQAVAKIPRASFGNTPGGKLDTTDGTQRARNSDSFKVPPPSPHTPTGGSGRIALTVFGGILLFVGGYLGARLLHGGRTHSKQREGEERDVSGKVREL